MGNARYIVFRQSVQIEAGYGVPDTCNYGTCLVDIDRGLDHLCGAVPGGDEYGCGQYFCDEHLSIPLQDEIPDNCQMCPACRRRWEQRQAEALRDLIVNRLTGDPAVKEIAPLAGPTSLLVFLNDGGEYEVLVKP